MVEFPINVAEALQFCLDFLFFSCILGTMEGLTCGKSRVVEEKFISIVCSPSIVLVKIWL